MSLRNTVKRQVKNAFRIIGDLKIKVIFDKTQNSSFDFGAGEVVSAPSGAYEVYGVYMESTTKPSDKFLERGRQGTLLFIEDEVAELKSYDTAYFNDSAWKVVPPIRRNGYTVEVIVAEVAS